MLDAFPDFNCWLAFSEHLLRINQIHQVVMLGDERPELVASQVRTFALVHDVLALARRPRAIGASSQSRLPPREGAAGAGAAAGGAAADEAPNDGRRAFALGFAPSLLAIRSNGMVL